MAILSFKRNRVRGSVIRWPCAQVKLSFITKQKKERKGCAKTWGGRLLVGQDTAGLTAKEEMVPGGASRAGQQLDPTVPETHCEDYLCLLVMENH